MFKNNLDNKIQYLYHYFEKSKGPFLNLSDLCINKAQEVMDKIKENNSLMVSHRYDGYLDRRKELEQIARDIFISKGGKPKRKVPHYMVVEKCNWLNTWYTEGTYVKIPISSFDPSVISFSYGDMFPTFSDRVKDNKEYRKKIYTLDEIKELIVKYGLPQAWNEDGKFGPERYIEVQVWDDVTINDCISEWNYSNKK